VPDALGPRVAITVTLLATDQHSAELVFVHGGGYWHRDSPQGVTLSRAEVADKFSDRDEAEQAAARLNRTVIHGGAAVFNDGWAMVES